MSQVVSFPWYGFRTNWRPKTLNENDYVLLLCVNKSDDYHMGYTVPMCC